MKVHANLICWSVGGGVKEYEPKVWLSAKVHTCVLKVILRSAIFECANVYLTHRRTSTFWSTMSFTEMEVQTLVILLASPRYIRRGRVECVVGSKRHCDRICIRLHTRIRPYLSKSWLCNLPTFRERAECEMRWTFENNQGVEIPRWPFAGHLCDFHCSFSPSVSFVPSRSLCRTASLHFDEARTRWKFDYVLWISLYALYDSILFVHL